MHSESNVSQALAAATSVVVTFPTGGTFLGTSSLTVTWQTTGPVASHTIRLSLDGGTSFAFQGTVGANDRQFTFELPTTFVDLPAVVRVVARDEAGNKLASGDSPVFTIKPDIKPPVVNVIYPNGGETFKPGDSVTVRWTSLDNVAVVAQDVNFSSDGGNTYMPVATGLAGNVNSLPWTVPNTLTIRGVIQVVARDRTGNQGGDRSDGFFKIGDTLFIVNINPDTVQVGAKGVQINVRGNALANATFSVTNSSGQATDKIKIDAVAATTNGVVLTISVAGDAMPGQYFIRATDAAGNVAQSPTLSVTAKAKDTEEKEGKEKEGKESKETKESKEKEAKETKESKDQKDKEKEKEKESKEQKDKEKEKEKEVKEKDFKDTKESKEKDFKDTKERKEKEKEKEDKEFKEFKEQRKELKERKEKEFPEDGGGFLGAAAAMQTNSVEERLARLEAAMSQWMTHFIDPASRPDLNASALNAERDE